MRHVYPGGFHKQTLGIREKLESVEIVLPVDLVYYNTFIVYDFEALFKQINKEIAQTTNMNEHIPVSYTLCDNQGNTKSEVKEEPKDLMECFIRDVLTLRKKILLALTEEFKPVFDDINVILTDAFQEIKDLDENDNCKDINKEGNPVDYHLAELQKKVG